MRLYQITFACGLAAGYVLGARAGQDRYEQIMKNARAFAEHPAVRQATQNVQSTATEVAKSAARVAASRGRDGLAKMTRRRGGAAVPGQAGRPEAGTPASATSERRGRRPGKPEADSGKRPPYAPVTGDFGDFELP